MRVSTPAMKLDVRLESADSQRGQLRLEGLAGLLPCEITLEPTELRQLLRMILRPSIVALLFRRDRPQR